VEAAIDLTDTLKPDSSEALSIATSVTWTWLARRAAPETLPRLLESWARLTGEAVAPRALRYLETRFNSSDWPSEELFDAAFDRLDEASFRKINKATAEWVARLISDERRLLELANQMESDALSVAEAAKTIGSLNTAWRRREGLQPLQLAESWSRGEGLPKRRTPEQAECPKTQETGAAIAPSKPTADAEAHKADREQPPVPGQETLASGGEADDQSR
jgi:hypothetical protein